MELRREVAGVAVDALVEEGGEQGARGVAEIGQPGFKGGAGRKAIGLTRLHAKALCHVFEGLTVVIERFPGKAARPVQPFAGP